MSEGLRSTVAIGIGNPDRGDDGAGRLAAEHLRRVRPDLNVRELAGEVTSLLAALEGTERAYIIDACVSGAEPGTIRRIDVGNQPLPADDFRMSSHGLGLVEAIELARALGTLPARCVVYAIEGRDFETGSPVTPAVAEAARRVADLVAGEIDAA